MTREEKHRSHQNVTLSNVKDIIREHITSHARQESYYSRGNTQKLISSPSLNINKLFKIIKESHCNIVCSKNTHSDYFQF